MEHIVEFLRSMDEPEMADEVANAHNRLECYSTGITNEIIESLRSVAENSLAELAALKAENERLNAEIDKYHDAPVVAYRHLMEGGWEYFDAPTGDDCPKCVPLIVKPGENK